MLLAPALDFSGNRVRDLGDRGLDDWRATDRLDVFHYGYGRVIPVHYELFADAPELPRAQRIRLDMPVLMFQGRRDTAVDPLTRRALGDARPNVELHLFDDDHQLQQPRRHLDRNRPVPGVRP